MFTPRNKETACGMWSTTYIIALCVVIVMVVVGLILSRKMSHKAVHRTILITTICAIVTEIGKMIFIGVTYGIDEVEFIPLYFCSLFMYCGVFASITKVKWLETTGLSFLTMGGIIGAIAFFSYPDACIPNYPIYHYMCLRTMLYHGAMIYIGFLILITGYYKPKAKDFLNYFIALMIIGILAYILNVVNGQNLMYISRPLNFELSKVVYNWNPTLYPFLFLILQVTVPFWASYSIYQLVNYIILKQKEKKDVYR